MAVTITVKDQLWASKWAKCVRDVVKNPNFHEDVHFGLAYYMNEFVPEFDGEFPTYSGDYGIDYGVLNKPDVDDNGVHYNARYANAMYLNAVYGPNIPVFEKGTGNIKGFISPPVKQLEEGRGYNYSTPGTGDHWMDAFRSDSSAVSQFNDYVLHLIKLGMQSKGGYNPRNTKDIVPTDFIE